MPAWGLAAAWGSWAPWGSAAGEPWAAGGGPGGALASVAGALAVAGGGVSLDLSHAGLPRSASTGTRRSVREVTAAMLPHGPIADTPRPDLPVWDDAPALLGGGRRRERRRAGPVNRARRRAPGGVVASWPGDPLGARVGVDGRRCFGAYSVSCFGGDPGSQSGVDSKSIESMSCD